MKLSACSTLIYQQNESLRQVMLSLGLPDKWLFINAFQPEEEGEE